MKMLKTMFVSGMIATGVYMLYNNKLEKKRKKFMKTGRKVIKNMGIV